MTRTSRAVVYEEPGRLEIRELPVPETIRSGGLLEVEACGVSRTDWEIFQGLHESVIPPVVLGREVVGTISALTQYQQWPTGVGDRILIEEFKACFHCLQCLEGRHRLCASTLPAFGQTSLSVETGLWGGFADVLFLHPRTIPHRVPDDLDGPLATAAITVANGISWSSKGGALRIGDAVLVVGLAAPGLGCLVAAHYGGARLVIGADLKVDEAQRDLALSLGADVVIDLGEKNLSETVAQLTNGEGVNVAIETVPSSAPLFSDMIHSTRTAGRIVLAAEGRGRALAIDLGQIKARELTVAGATARDSTAVDQALGLLAANQKELAPLRGQIYGLNETQAAIQANAEQGKWRTVVVPSA